ncbi:MAG: glycosyltransferase family 2 protein [Mesonia sp.]|uniref:glycosyltransferase family 2 protein n=1 Tax=Mesonia sp. TaxID=1960830 RepID=UPI003F9C6059
MPRFSVIVPLFNKENYIKETLESVLQQTYTDFEIIIVDDGSTDKSAAIVKEFQNDRIKYFYQENLGAASTRNEGINKTNSNLIAFLDADDYWYPFYLEEQLRLINKYPSENVFSTAQQINKAGQTFAIKYSLPDNFNKDGVVNYFEASLKSSILHSSSIVLKKDILKKIGIYDPNIKSGQDTDFYIRIGLNYGVVFSEKICSQYHIIENSLFRSSTSLKDKLDIEKYSCLESKNSKLKKFLDLNRFSLAIFCKIKNDKIGFKKNYRKIDLSNLNLLQILLLNSPSPFIRLAKNIQDFLLNKGLYLTPFK